MDSRAKERFLSWPKSAPLARNVERLGLLLIALVLCLPLLVALCLPTSAPAWLRNTTLLAVEPWSPGPWSWQRWLSGELQHDLERQVAEAAGGRELLIRVAGQLHYELFRMPATAQGARMIVGRDGHLFLRDQLLLSLTARQPVDVLRRQVDLLARVQQACTARGLGFVLLLSPAKSTVYRDHVPARYASREDDQPSSYDRLLALARQRGLAVVDGRQLALTARPGEHGDLLFPRGSVHWGDHLAALAAREVVRSWRSQGLPLVDPEWAVRVQSEPREPSRDRDDRELLLRMHLLWPAPVATTTVSLAPLPLREAQKLRLLAVGSSFTEYPWRILAGSGQVCEADLLFYWKIRQSCYFEGQELRLAGGADGDRQLLGADALLVEMHEEQLAGDLQYIEAFAERFLAAASRPGPEPRFHYASFLEVPPGEEVPFAEGRSLVGPGLGGLDGAGQWTHGREAQLRLQLPFSETGGAVEFRLQAALVPQPLTFTADGVTLAQVTLTDPAARWVRVNVPRQSLSPDGRVTLKLQLGNPAGEAGLGVYLTRVRAWPLGAPPSRFVPLQPDRTYRLGSVGPNRLAADALSGFSAAEPTGRWTDAALAGMRLRVPPGRWRLQFRVAPYLAPALSPGQRVRVLANGRVAAVWTLTDPNARLCEADVEGDAEGKLELRLEILRPLSPQQAGESADPRLLGLYFRSLTLCRSELSRNPPTSSRMSEVVSKVRDQPSRPPGSGGRPRKP